MVYRKEIDPAVAQRLEIHHVTKPRTVQFHEAARRQVEKELKTLLLKLFGRVLGTEEVNLADARQTGFARTHFVEWVRDEDDPARFPLLEFKVTATDGLFRGKFRIVRLFDRLG